ncbi:MAG: ASCH domain-containing protein [bacterium]
MNKILKFWSDFQEKNPQYKSEKQPPHYYFCDNKEDANYCLNLVLKDIKRATASSLWWFKKHDEELPKIGDLAIVTDWEGEPFAITKVTAVNLKAYIEVDGEFAFREGEGDKSLEYWRKVHWAYYGREMAPFNESPTEDMIIVCEEFETIYKLSN